MKAWSVTDDTKRALEAIAPIARELNIDVEADDKFLYCNGQAIGISCNSTSATILEFVAYVMVKRYSKDFNTNIPDNFKKRLKRYWKSESDVMLIKALSERREHGI